MVRKMKGWMEEWIYGEGGGMVRWLVVGQWLDEGWVNGCMYVCMAV